LKKNKAAAPAVAAAAAPAPAAAVCRFETDVESFFTRGHFCSSQLFFITALHHSHLFHHSAMLPAKSKARPGNLFIVAPIVAPTVCPTRFGYLFGAAPAPAAAAAAPVASEVSDYVAGYGRYVDDAFAEYQHELRVAAALAARLAGSSSSSTPS
jgi:hypothetical protein